MKQITSRKVTPAVFALMFSILIIGCSDDSATTNNPNKYVNNWILENMDLYYLWNNQIPSSPDKSKAPDDFFASLLSNEDRFSWIQENYQELLNSLQGISKEAGYHFKLYRVSQQSEAVIAQVMYIKPNSIIDREELDLKRGDVIDKINGQTITLSNYRSLLNLMNENHTIHYVRPLETGGEADMGTLALTTEEFAENPHFMATVFEAEGSDKKIGYYVYNFFATGAAANTSEYNTQMDNFFAQFKSAGITDLIIDLRFNSGGAEAATINLASLTGANIDNSKVFVKRQYNSDLQQAFINDPQYGEDFLLKKFINKAQNVGTQLTNGRVYILTGYSTASASELLINGLKPFMDVFLIGDVTVGKNVGSISIYEENDSKNTWGMQPIVVKSYNSLNQSEYGDGFIPNIENPDNDYYIYPLGDENETLLSIALDHILYGTIARKSAERAKHFEQTLGTSADFKHGSYNLVIDDIKVKEFFEHAIQ